MPNVPPTVGVGGSGAPAVSSRGLPGYEVVQELGRGAMGVVYQARQVALKRDVAVKMILVGDHASEHERRRFMAEAEVIASIQHPGVVQVFDFGTSGGLPYFVMEYCPGGTLAGRLGGKIVPDSEAARLMASLADAVHAAHEKGIIHRDLKPGNVLLIADGSPKVADFGLARRAEGSGMTLSGAVVGTPAYMAPEQARGLKAIGPAADVYALGAILYECLTGQVPFSGETAQDTLVRVITDVPAAPHTLNAATSPVLEAICLKCLEKDPTKRYPGAKDLAADLRRFLAGEPVSVRSAPLAPKARKRWPWVVLFLAILVALWCVNVYFGVDRYLPGVRQLWLADLWLPMLLLLVCYVGWLTWPLVKLLLAHDEIFRRFVTFGVPAAWAFSVVAYHRRVSTAELIFCGLAFLLMIVAVLPLPGVSRRVKWALVLIGALAFSSSSAASFLSG